MQNYIKDLEQFAEKHSDGTKQGYKEIVLKFIKTNCFNYSIQQLNKLLEVINLKHFDF